MNKLIYIDVGTHFGQEFQSIFSSQWEFYLKVMRRLIGYYLLKRGEKVPIKNFLKMVSEREKIKNNKKDFLFYFIEANSNIINYSNVYKNAHGVFNCALTGDDNLNIKNLFFAKTGDELGQGSSIFSNKGNISTQKSIPTIGVPSKLFFNAFKRYLDKTLSDYVVILRINCEGVEDDVIYASHEIFRDKLVLIMGSLNDVKVCKGEAAYLSMEKYLKGNSLPFVSFGASMNTWIKAHSAISHVHKKYC